MIYKLCYHIIRGDDMLQSKIIKERKQQLNLTIDDMAQALNVSRPTICRWLSGDTKKITASKLEKLAEVLQTTHDHLMGKDASSRMKPILGIVKAGYDMFAEENILGYEEVTEKESTRGDFYLKVCGDSMTGSRIYDGDLIYVQACNDVDSGQIGVVLINGDEATVKKIIKKDDMLILEASNPTVENRYFSRKEVEELPVRIIGRVLHTKVSFE